MLCELCNKHEATVHLTEIIKDIKSEVHLCDICTRDMGLNAKMSTFSLSVTEMMSLINSNSPIEQNEVFCHACGTSFSKYSRSGMLGCVECYISFSESLKGIIIGYHGSIRHIGKMPHHAVSINKSEKKDLTAGGFSIDSLKLHLEKLLDDENYEEAALIRDRIKKIHAGGVQGK
jgi:protein arginine kinase activator